MTIRTEQIGTTLVVKLSGEIDQSCAGEIRSDIDRQLQLCPIKNLILDFAKVSFMDSSGIGMILGRYKQIKARNGTIMIIRAQPQVDRILELSGLKKIIDCG
ncbi:MAG: anti-sigma F factor antagonist [Clostridia bacterium]|nr:anti-sigma F factor antagonist [Clostridia bacterium]